MANASNRRAIEQAARQEKGKRASELREVQYLMMDPRGRSLAHRLMNEWTGADSPLPWSSNAMTLARDSGVQSVGFRLLQEIRAACPEQELVMRREAATLAQRAEMSEDVPDDDESD
jgi:hypothetical protein